MGLWDDYARAVLFHQLAPILNNWQEEQHQKVIDCMTVPKCYSQTIITIIPHYSIRSYRWRRRRRQRNYE